jgi:hypothetical protein
MVDIDAEEGGDVSFIVIASSSPFNCTGLLKIKRRPRWYLIGRTCTGISGKIVAPEIRSEDHRKLDVEDRL